MKTLEKSTHYILEWIIESTVRKSLAPFLNFYLPFHRVFAEMAGKKSKGEMIHRGREKHMSLIMLKREYS